MFRLALDYWTARQRRSRWMTPAVAALIFGGCTTSDSALHTPRRMVHTVSAAAHSCVEFCHKGHWLHSRRMDDCRTASTARHVARRDLKQLVKQTDCRPSRDFAHGFEQAYVDVALGGSGDVPAYPPQQYWELWQRTPQGHARAQHWFEGYAAGAEQAWSTFGDHNVIPTTGLEDGMCEMPTGYGGR